MTDIIMDFVAKHAPLAGALASLGALLFSLKTYLRLTSKPNLHLGFTDNSLSPDLLTFFRLTIRNDGRKSAREVIVWIWIPLEAGHRVTHIESQVEVVEEDDVWKGVGFRRPGEGQERLWRLKAQMLLEP